MFGLAVPRLALPIMGQLDPIAAMLGVVGTWFGACLAERLSRKHGLDLGIEHGVVLQIEQRSHGWQTTTYNSQARFDGCPDQKVVEYI